MKRKEFNKVSLPLKILLKKMYKKYGYNQSLFIIENMKEPTSDERLLMIDYIKILDSKNNKI